MFVYPQSYQVIVIGAGHAGCEAALSAAKMGFKTLVLTIDLDHVAFMPCNPSLGGPAKGHIVREIDALGGEMGHNIDATMIQVRMLNTRKGPAVQALRAQADKKKYHLRMKKVLEEESNLDLKQGLVTKILVEEGKIRGVETATGIKYLGQKVILTTGTFLRGRIIIGETTFEAGPNQQLSAKELSRSLQENGFTLKRFKTGTPPRVLGRTIDYEKTEPQPGHSGSLFFSFMHEGREGIQGQLPCHLTHTNPRTHAIINENIHRAPLFSGVIEGTGPRYCPSIEDKVVSFPNKNSHQIFIEPESLSTQEMYLSGLPTSLPEDVQFSFLRTITGLERVDMVRPGYAIEYDVIDTRQLNLTLETRHIEGLFTAGQVNGTSGYEEAGGQGLIAGINAALSLKGEAPLILDRAQAYIGVLIDDLVTKGTEEPYRMLTSRAEYRLLLRQDNADQRLSPLGRKIGLLSDNQWKLFQEKQQEIEMVLGLLEKIQVKPTPEVNEILQEKGSGGLNKPVSLKEIFRRPEITWVDLLDLEPELPKIRKGVQEQLETTIKYEGYIERQKREIEHFKKLENKLLPDEINYEEVPNLRTEAREKLKAVRPRSVGQAGRINGVSPADITSLLIFLERKKRND